jgi:hypothetical protein
VGCVRVNASRRGGVSRATPNALSPTQAPPIPAGFLFSRCHRQRPVPGDAIGEARIAQVLPSHVVEGLGTVGDAHAVDHHHDEAQVGKRLHADLLVAAGVAAERPEGLGHERIVRPGVDVLDHTSSPDRNRAAAPPCPRCRYGRRDPWRRSSAPVVHPQHVAHDPVAMGDLPLRSAASAVEQVEMAPTVALGNPDHLFAQAIDFVNEAAVGMDEGLRRFFDRRMRTPARCIHRDDAHALEATLDEIERETTAIAPPTDRRKRIRARRHEWPWRLRWPQITLTTE